MELRESPTFRSLQVALANSSGVRTEILLYDNTPSGTLPEDLPANIRYVASTANTGLATAYNLAVRMAAEGGFPWLLTLDQDTELPENFLQEMGALASRYQADASVAAIVPRIVADSRVVSPYWYRRHTFPQWFAEGYSGLPARAVYAFNSGSLLRVAAIREAGGYSPLFWLDSSDIWLFRQFERQGLRMFVAGALRLQHDFSMSGKGGKMSLARYRNAVEAGSAFCDLELGRLAGIEHTGLLLRRYLKQVLTGEDGGLRAATRDVIAMRLFVPKQRRLAAWRRAQEQRIAGYGTEAPRP